MKKAIAALMAGLALGAGVTWLLSRHGAENATPSEKHKPETHVVRGTNGERVVKLGRPRQVSAGIVTANPQSMGLPPEVKVMVACWTQRRSRHCCSISNRPKPRSMLPPESMSAPGFCSRRTKTPRRALWNPPKPR